MNEYSNQTLEIQEILYEIGAKAAPPWGGLSQCKF